MGLMSDRKTLREHRAGLISSNAACERLGIRLSEPTAFVESITDASVGAASSVRYDNSAFAVDVDPNWRDDWALTSINAPLWDVLWGSNCKPFRQARQTAERVIECGWANENLDPAVLAHVLWKWDLRSKAEAIHAANLIHDLGWAKPEPEPSEVIAYDGTNGRAVTEWLGGDWIDGDDGAQTIVLPSDLTITGRVTGVWPGSILHRVGHLIEVLTPESPESTVSHEPANAEEPDHEAIRDYWTTGPGSETNPEWTEEKGSPDVEPEATSGPPTFVIHLPKIEPLTQQELDRITAPFMEMQAALIEGMRNVKWPKMPRP